MNKNALDDSLPTFSCATTSTRESSLARKVRERELAEARAKEEGTLRKLQAQQRLREKAQRRSLRTRRVLVEQREGERVLVFRGPHASFDLWLLTSLLGSTVALPLVVGLCFVHWGLALSVALLIVIPWLTLVYSPMRISVTSDGYFDARRPFLPLRDIGTLDELILEVQVDRSEGGGFYRQCSIESRRWKLWVAKNLSPADAETIEAFKRYREPLPPFREHEGAYREAA